RDLLLHRLDHLGMAMAKQERAMAAEIVDIAMAVDIPFSRTLGPCDVQPIGLDVARIMSDAAGKEPASLVRGGRRARGRGTVGGDDRGIRRQGVWHAPHSSGGSGLGDVLGRVVANEKGRPEGRPLHRNPAASTAASRCPQARTSVRTGILVTAAENRGWWLDT